MKHSFTALVLVAIASTASAGLTYKVQSSTTGMRNVTIAGTVSMEGPHLRMDVAIGDQMLFKDNDIVVSNDGGKTMTVLDPATKNYYDLELEQMLGTSTSMLNAFGSMVKIDFTNPHVSVRDDGDGGTVEGLPTHKYVLDASYDINIDAMGQKMISHLQMTTQSWMTDRLSSDFTNFLQLRGMRTGVEALDKLIEAQGTLHGFPLKQVSTIQVTQGDNNMTMTTTSSVSDIQRRTIDAAQFAMPTGYTKVDDPITKMMRQLKQ